MATRGNGASGGTGPTTRQGRGEREWGSSSNNSLTALRKEVCMP
jgi:hypothetical protein